MIGFDICHYLQNKTAGLTPNMSNVNVAKIVEKRWPTEGWRQRGSFVYSVNSQDCWYVHFESPSNNEKHGLLNENESTCRSVDRLYNVFILNLWLKDVHVPEKEKKKTNL